MLKKNYLTLFSFLFPAVVFASSSNNPYPFYVGGSAGYGSTNWSGLIDSDPNGNNYYDVGSTTPIAAEDTGLVYGVFAGYNFTSHFAIEVRYDRFPTSTVTFAPFSNYASAGLTNFSSSTYTWSAVAKLIEPIYSSPFSGFLEFGGVYTHRSDILADTGADYPDTNPPQGVNGQTYNFGGEFGGGIIYNITDHLFSNLEFTYGTGNGGAVEYPAKNYIPFTYALQLELGYRFGL